MRQRRELDFFNTLVHRQTGLGGITPSFLLDFAYGDISSRGVAVTPSFTRATTATFIDQDRMVRTALSGEARFQGLRRVQNNVAASENLTGGGATSTSGGTGTPATCTAGFTAPDGTATAFRVRADIGAGTLNADFSAWQLSATVRVGSVWIKSNTSANQTVLTAFTGAGNTVVATPTWQRLTWTNPGPASAMVFGTLGNLPTSKTIDVLVWRPQSENDPGQAVPIPAEYFSTGVLAAPYQGANADGVRYLPWHNGNVMQQNLFARSQALNTAPWTDPGGALTVTENNASAPDGSFTATTFAYNGSATGGRFQTLAVYVIGQTYSFSVYAKSIASSNVILRLGSDTVSDNACQFNLRAGTVTNIGNATGTIVAVGGGWYRCTTTLSALATTLGGILYVSNMVAGETLALWGAQVQPGRRAGTYVATTSAAINNNIVEEARGDPITTNATYGFGYLVEITRVNLLLQSQTIGVAPWGSAFINAYVANATVGPDGTTTASKIVEDATATQVHQAAQSFAMTDNLDYVFSVYLKAAERTWAQVFLIAKTGGQRNAYFNLSTGAIGTVSGGTTASIAAMGNGWYRCTVSMNAGVGAGGQAAWIGLATGDNGGTYNGDGVSGIYAWGAQAEQSTFPSSYIATVGATVTRNTDQLTYNFAPPAAGTLLAQWQVAGTELAGSFVPVSINDGTANNRIQLFVQDPGRTMQNGVVSGGVLQANYGTRVVAINTAIKACASYTAGAQALSVNGQAVETAAGASIPAMTRVEIGHDPNTTTMCGTISRVALYSGALSSSFLVAAST